MNKYKSKYLIGFRKNVDKGKEGLNAGLPIRSPKLSRYLHGLLPQRLILLGGDTGSGKTAYADDHLVVHPHLFLLDNPFHPVRLKTHYWSLEISPEEKIAKWCCAEIFKIYNSDISVLLYNDGKEDKLLDSDYILGRALDINEKAIKIKSEHEVMIDEVMERLDALLDHIEFLTSKPTSAHIIGKLDSVAKQYGQFEEYQGEILYHDSEPNTIRQAVYDHIGLFAKTKEGKKATIDDVSREWIWYRDKCKYNIIAISQFNRNIQDVQRMKLGIEPQLGDFKDTSNTQEDANQVLALFDPYRYKIMDWESYNVGILKDRFRGIVILKNRHGHANKKFGMRFIGEVGLTTELALPNELSHVDYQKIINLR